MLVPRWQRQQQQQAACKAVPCLTPSPSCQGPGTGEAHRHMHRKGLQGVEGGLDRQPTWLEACVGLRGLRAVLEG